jgi:pilus assembly protein Flp/PilA
MKFLAKHIKAFLADEQGATAIEYGLIAALIAVAIIIGAGALGTNLNTLFNSIATKLGGVTVN